MQPLHLTLTGFRGIRDGLGLDELRLDLQALAGDAALVAITGRNGSGKTTVMDNLTPYCLLASRGSGTGGFSYYDHVFLPESVKDLVWAHAGQRYRSQIVVRLNGRRRTEAFLHRLDDDGHWRPVVLDDGLRSDGRLETYNGCVERLCGSADTFFTSVFAAQGRRPLSSYRNAEIKGLLADLLGQDQILAMGAQAGDTVRLLKGGLAGVRQGGAELELACAQVAAELQRLGGASMRQERAASVLQLATADLEAAVAAHARCTAEHAQQQAVSPQRARLALELRALQEQARTTAQDFQTQDTAALRSLERLRQRVQTRGAQVAQRRDTLLRAQQGWMQTLAQEGSVRHALHRLPLARRSLALRQARAQAAADGVAALREAETAQQREDQRLAAIEREAGKAVLWVQELTHRAGLVTTVPCVGTDLQHRCGLLGDAHAARRLVPDAQAVVDRCARERRQVLQDRRRTLQRLYDLARAPQALVVAEQAARRAGDRVVALRELAAQGPACDQARSALADLALDLAALPTPDQAADWTAEDLAERSEILQARRSVAARAAQARARLSTARARCEAALAALPPAPDGSALAQAAAAVARARTAQLTAQQALVAATRERQAVDGLQAQHAAQSQRLAAIKAHAASVERALGDWTLLARCLGHDGLIALAIDDVGPTLAHLTNELLLASHGPRFTVVLQTQCMSGKGELREGFEILVHDGDSGEPKPLGLMSGGERTWIEACLVRAVALYLAQHTGRGYDTLFSDEADGALDPERKRMFMAMKRAVLRLGGYSREYFVTQTPELVAVADAVIDLDRLWAARPVEALHDA
ncbi:hypothetical protein [Pseudorhodoferax sp. Leaf267]|uniref:hypothetical protein n=1 Tax=Pseudorhodoferax sp. Leaf267 TaxID=1736316 RepID=UPI0006F22C35|nr:hypothetical protein [Pseudorhodoferax sp. Leaf267]KQP23346.1 hypothetical protein ASF43_05650 [Pseudorhodoferax sp. Leaf267]